MEPKILVAYATRAGSTEELAHVIGEVLREEGFAVDVQPVRQLQSLAGYGTVVIAAALYMGRLHKEARRFLATFRAELTAIPVALFVPGPTDKKEKGWAGARIQLEKELMRVPWLKPLVVHVVGGRFDPARMGFPFTWIPALRKIPVSDARDWDEIRRLTRELAGKLMSTTV